MNLFASTPIDQTNGPYPRRWAALGVLCLSLLIVVMANTSLVVAAPSMTQELHLSSSQLQWVIDGYTVPYAALLLVFGAVGDKFSRRGALITGLLVFASGAIFGDLVHTAGLVIAARAAMGFGAAAIMPATLSLLAATFPRQERAKAITAWTATSGLALALGPLLSGWLLQSHAWGSTFLINVPLAVIAVAAALVLVPPSKAERHIRLDVVGGLLSIVSVAALVYAIIQGLNFGWNVGPVTAAIVAIAGFLAFGFWELRYPHPIVDVRRFRDRHFSGAMLSVLIFFFGIFGAFYYVTQHLQFVYGYDPLSTGVRLLPLAAAVFVGAGLTGPLTRKLGARAMVVAGMVIGTVGVFLLTGISAASTYETFVVPLVLLGLGVGLALSPCTETIMGRFPEQELGVAGGLNDTALELGGALGIAVLGSMLATSYRNHLVSAVGHHMPAAALNTAKSSIGEALAVAQHLAHTSPAGIREARQLVDMVDQSFAHAVAHTSLIAGIILLAGTLLVMVIFRGSSNGAASVPKPSGADIATAAEDSAAV